MYVCKLPVLWAWISTLIIGLSDIEKSGWKKVSFFTGRGRMWQIVEYAFIWSLPIILYFCNTLCMYKSILQEILTEYIDKVDIVDRNR